MDFISGSYFRNKCKYSLGKYTSPTNSIPILEIDGQLNNNLVFCKTEYISKLHGNLNNLPEQFILLTHNSDININQQIVNDVLSKFENKIKRWYAQNLDIEHELIFPLPIGLANPKWSHGNINRFYRIIQEDYQKSNLFYVNFNVATNPQERNYCLKFIGKNITTPYPNYVDLNAYNNFVENTQENYLRDIASSYFTISPKGNGIDCHKTWEAIYMKSIPIVTRSVCSIKFKEMGIPMIVLDDWSNFNTLELTPDLYKDIWQDFDINNINFNFWVSL